MVNARFAACALSVALGCMVAAHPVSAARIPSADQAFVRHGPAVVGVSAGPPGAEVATTGFFLTSRGLIATVMLPADSARVTFADGSTRVARVLARDTGAPGEGVLAVLQLEAAQDEVFPALAVRTAPPPAAPAVWWLALSFADGRASPALGGLRKKEGNGRLRLDVPAGPGAPVLVDDEVIAVVVWRLDQTSSMAVDVSALVTLAKRAALLATVPNPPQQGPTPPR